MARSATQARQAPAGARPALLVGQRRAAVRAAARMLLEMRDRDRQQRDRPLARDDRRARRAPDPRRSRRASRSPRSARRGSATRVTERRSAKRTRTVTVRPAQRLGAQPRGDAVGEMAQRRAEDRARRRASGRAPTARRPSARGGACRISRGSRFQASAASFSPAAGPSRRSSARPRRRRPAGRWSSTPISASRALVDRADAPHQLDRQVVQEGELGRRDRRPPARRAWRPARRSWPDAWCARRRPRSAGRARRARGARIVAGDLGRRAEQMRAAGDVGEGLVDRDALDQRREVVEHLDRGVAEPLVLA